MNKPKTKKTAKRASGSLERMVRLLVANHTPEELALGYLRYETVRKMSPRTFGELHKLNLSGKFFDSLVDESLQSCKQPNAEVSEVAVADSTKTSGVRPPLSLD